MDRYTKRTAFIKTAKRGELERLALELDEKVTMLREVLTQLVAFNSPQSLREQKKSARLRVEHADAWDLARAVLSKTGGA